MYRPTYGQQRTCGRTCGVELRRVEGTDNRKHWPQTKVWLKHCTHCTKLYVSRHPHSATCSAPCKRARQSAHSSASIQKRYATDTEFRDRIIATEQARRANKLGLGSRQITIGYLGKRDQWRCGICHQKINSHREASIDHIVPLSKGGQHTLENVHVAHRSCNYSKGNRGAGEQLILVG